MLFGSQGFSSASWSSTDEFGQLLKTSSDSIVLQLAEAEDPLAILIAESDNIILALAESEVKRIFNADGHFEVDDTETLILAFLENQNAFKGSGYQTLIIKKE